MTHSNASYSSTFVGIKFNRKKTFLFLDLTNYFVKSNKKTTKSLNFICALTHFSFSREIKATATTKSNKLFNFAHIKTRKASFQSLKHNHFPVKSNKSVEKREVLSHTRLCGNFFVKSTISYI